MPPAFGRGPLLKTLETSKSKSSSTSPASNNKPALAEARQESANRLQQAWQDIFDRYIQNDELEGQDDEYDLATLEVVHDAGFLQREDTYEIGCFGLPGAMGQDDETSEEEEVVDQDEEDDDEGNATQEDDHENQVIDVSSSEDEMGNWAHKIGEPAPIYFEQRRAQEVSDRDMQSFLSWNATKAQAQRQREFSILSRQLKQESVKPVSITPSSKWSMASRAESIKPTIPLSTYTPPASVKPESTSSSTIFSQPRGISSSLRKTKPFYTTPSSSPSKPCSSASSSITAAVQATGANSIRIQAAACESDSSDDDLSIILPPSITSTSSVRLNPVVKKREETVDIGLSFSTPQHTRPSQTPLRQCRTTTSKLRMRPVVEVITKRWPPIASTSRLRAPSTLPKQSSPLKESRTFSSTSAVIIPPSPPASRSSQALVSPVQDSGKGKRKASPLLVSESDNEEEECNGGGNEDPLVESSSEDEMALPDIQASLSPSRRATNVQSSSYSPSSSPTSSHTPTIHRQQHYFPDGPPIASTSSAPAKVRTNSQPRKTCPPIRQAPSTVRAKRVRSPSPTYKRGEEPWRIRKPPPLPLPLPTPPPSLPSSSSSRDSVPVEEEDSDSDVFTSPLPHTPKRQMRKHPRRLKSESEDAAPDDKAVPSSSEKKTTVLKDTPYIVSDDDDDELLLLPTPVKLPTTARKPVRKRSTSPAGIPKHVVVQSPKRSSTPRRIRVKTPPDEDSDESDDPLGCW